MQIHELPEITTIASGGYLATDNGTQTTKIDYDKLAKAIIEQYSGSTLAGSAQSVQAALNGLIQKSLPTEIAPRTTIASNDDLNTYTTAGIYRCATATIAASLSNCPVSNVGFNLDVVQLYNTAFAYQRITASTGIGATAVVEVYERFINVRDSIYGTWKKVPTRAEVDALNSRTDGIKTDNFSMNTADTYTKTLDLRTIYLVTVGKLNTRNNSYSGMYLVIPHQTASSILTIAESSALSSITIDADTLSITTNTSYVIASITRLTNMA